MGSKNVWVSGGLGSKNVWASEGLGSENVDLEVWGLFGVSGPPLRKCQKRRVFKVILIMSK